MADDVVYQERGQEKMNNFRRRRRRMAPILDVPRLKLAGG